MEIIRIFKKTRFLLFIISEISCIQSFELAQDQFNLKQANFRYQNEATIIYDKSYLNSDLKKNLYFRYRFLPFLIPYYESIPIYELTSSHKVIIHYDEELFKKLKNQNFNVNLVEDPFYTSELNLFYTNPENSDEVYFPTIILMINSTTFHHRLTTSRGMRLFIIMRFSIFTRSGEEVAFCQKHLFQNIFSNDFFLDYILLDNSPFLKDLNGFNYTNNDNIIYLKINECKKELFNAI
ncbi:hypothetical protein LPTSP4_36750 [Leptospira ryugenii]|uniref:Uncharacterized protein n=1 Tax=Leptospira ryugenii TaxID=1917863 RepID=A0A2P2E5J2_9LEPT|nr:hypothetical protein [Leptospira ryugenii]GBF52137.1 hypothetical protein LPTSP4_36750 [Leptospira ryugenii]